MSRPAGRDALIAFVLTGAVLAAFPRILSPDWVFFQRDVLSYWYPMVATFVRVVGRGEMPLWDPYEAFGLPLWADPGAQVAYPPTWLNLLLPPHVVYKLLILGHLLAGGAGAMALARRLGLGRLAAATGAVLFACSGPIVSAATLIHHLCGAVWVPWSLWALEGVLHERSRRRVGVLALVLGVQALAGSAEMCAMTGLAGGLRLLALAGERKGRALRPLPALLAAAAIAALVAAAQWVPTAARLGETSRARFTQHDNLFWSVHPATLVDLFVPRLVSEMSMGAGVRAALFEGREPFLASLYLGIAALPLVLLSPRSRRPCRTWILAGFGVFLALALGRYLPPATLVLGLPPLSLFRYPAKYLLPMALFWALLAALGAEVWARAWTRRDRLHGALVGAALASAAVGLVLGGAHVASSPQAIADLFDVAEPFRAWMAVLAARKLQLAAAWLGIVAAALLFRAWSPAWSRPSAALAAAVLAADVVAAARGVNVLAPVDLVRHRPPFLAEIPSLAEQPRLLSAGDAIERLNQSLARGPKGWEHEWGLALGRVEMMAAPMGTSWGLRGSYDADFTGLAPPSLPFMSALVRQVEAVPLSTRLLQMGNVAWVTDSRPDGFPLLPERSRTRSVFAQPLRLLQVPAPLPACFVVPGVRRAASDEAAIVRIASLDFDPRREVVLSGAGPERGPATEWSGEARTLTRDATLLRIETETSGPGVLVAVEAFDRDWRATVDGRPVTIERANVLFRGVPVPPGRHVVEMRYFPRSVIWGLGLCAVGLSLAGVLVLGGREGACRPA